jgi:hypothetical protein
VSVTTGEDAAEDRRRQLALLTELREVEHWRRLVAARIDLAVAAVAAVDEPVVRNLPAAPAVPFGLRELIGLAPPGNTRGEVEALLRLRAVQRDLDAYAHALRATTRVATQDLLSRLDDPADPAGPASQDPDDEDAPPAPVILLEARRRRRCDPDGVA